MDMGQVQIAIGINWNILDGIVRYLYRLGKIPSEVTVRNIQVHLSEPRVEVVSKTGSAEKDDISLALRLQGSLTLPGSESTKFSGAILLKPFVISKPSDAPAASFAFNGVAYVDPPILKYKFSQIVKDELVNFLHDINIPIYEPLIEALGQAYFGDTPPAIEEWSLGFCLSNFGSYLPHPKAPQGPIKAPPFLIATVALPREDARLPVDQIDQLTTYNGTGIQIIIAKAAMNAFLNRNASQMVGHKHDGATIKSLSMKMFNNGIEINGKAERSGATIKWKGPIYLNFHNYTEFGSYKGVFGSSSVRKTLGPFSQDGWIEVVTKHVSVDINMPWYLYVAQFALGILGPAGWIIKSMYINPVLKEAKNAPDLLRDSLGSQVRQAFQNMTARLSKVSDLDELPVVLLGSNAWISEGNYYYSFNAFCGYNEAQISQVYYDAFKLPAVEGKSVGGFILDSGQHLIPTELGMLMKRGILNIPGYHGVRAPYGYYVRSNPNKLETDNLVPPSDITVFR